MSASTSPATFETTIDTRDFTGMIHMEAPHPFRSRLRDFCAIWGSGSGPGTLGDLKDSGSDREWVYVNES